MNPISPFKSLAVALVSLAVIVLGNLCFYTVGEHEQAILTQFGKTIGEPVTEAGFHAKIPLIQAVNRIDKRVLEWDGRAAEMPTRDKLYVVVDTFGRWRVSDPLKFFTRMRDERSALSRLDDIIGSEVRNAVAKNDLIEIVRTTKDRKAAVDESIEGSKDPSDVLLAIRRGRTEIESEVVKASAPKLKDFGIELIDVRFMRINYNSKVSAKIHERMISERQQIASRFRSEGEGEAAKILGTKERELRRIESESYRAVQKIRGEADATATEIYAKAYGQGSEASEFYRFLRTMDTYRKTLSNDTTLIMSTDSDLYRYLKHSTPVRVEPPVPAVRKP